jgi:hypothetical protein
MAVTDRLFPRRLFVDRLQRQRDFNEFLFHFSLFASTVTYDMEVLRGIGR